MSAPYDALPFPRGSTRSGGTPTDTAYVAPEVGQEYRIRDTLFSTNRITVLRAVKNDAGFAVLPKRRVQLSADGKSITGYARLASERGYPVDHLLPSAGCADDDVCYITVEGPAVVLTDLANYSADIAAGDLLNGQTAATSGATTSGRVKLRTVAAATADATAGQRNVTEGDGANMRAISTALTNATNSDLLVDVSRNRAS